MERGVYVHIPFCQQICHYCDFNKVLIKNQPVANYLDALRIEGEKRLQGEDHYFNTIYIGGGTPTSLTPTELETLFENLGRAGIRWDEKSEVTVEVNPDGIDEDRLRVLARNGVNRLSMGVQTFDPNLLTTLGRTHKSDDAEEVLAMARKQGFNNISIDLMFALPGQTFETWRDTLNKAVELNPDHVSAYGLKVEAKTKFHNWLRAGKLALMSEDDEADMYDELLIKLEEAGFQQYEISNFSKEGKQSRHNLIYWRNQPYLALGAGAHGYLDNTRYENIRPIPHYLKKVESGEIPELHQQKISQHEQMEEEMFLGLRLYEGVSPDEFTRKFQTPFTEVYGEVSEQLVDDGLLEKNQGRLRLTERGKLLGNEVFAAFLMD